jgi:hypothetical protein
LLRDVVEGSCTGEIGCSEIICTGTN